MNFKELIRELIEDFFAIFTCSILGYIIFMYVLGAEYTLTFDLVVILVLSVMIALAGLIIYSGNECKRYEMVIRYIIHSFIAIGVCLAVATYIGWILWSIPITVIRFTVLIVGITISVHIVLFFQTKLLSDKLNDKLKERYQKED